MTALRGRALVLLLLVVETCEVLEVVVLLFLLVGCFWEGVLLLEGIVLLLEGLEGVVALLGWLVDAGLVVG